MQVQMARTKELARTLILESWDLIVMQKLRQRGVKMPVPRSCECSRPGDGNAE